MKNQKNKLTSLVLGLLTSFLIVSCSTKTVVKQSPSVEPEIIEVKNNQVFNYKSKLTWVSDLTKVANCTVNLDSFQQRVIKIKSFDFTDANGEQVIKSLMAKTCTIRTYKTKNPFSKAIATTYRSNAVDLYLNLRKNPREVLRMVNTVIHECLHNAGFSHGDNSSIGKENSVNYKVGLIAQKEGVKCL